MFTNERMNITLMRSRDSDWRAWLHLRSVFMRRCGKSTINEMTLTRHSMFHLLNVPGLDVMDHYDELANEGLA